MKAFWEARYAEKEYAYGTTPNLYFKSIIDTLSPGKILLAAEGEGRNAVYAATKGWDVVAYDWSENAAYKAQQLANQHQVQINYLLASLQDLNLVPYSFDVLGLICVHYPETVREVNHQKLNQFLKPDGHVIMEAFSKSHLAFSEKNPAVGGPKQLSQLYDLEVAQDFHDCSPLHLAAQQISLAEGVYHQGEAHVIRYHGLKK
ncbi:MAG: class I SAM-dependent methyltransferase [Flavobacteriaceae bacterium]